MTLSEVVQSVMTQVNPTSVTLLVLFLISEVLGSNDKIRASAIYQVIKAAIMAVVEQVLPKSPTPPPAPPQA